MTKLDERLQNLAGGKNNKINSGKGIIPAKKKKRDGRKNNHAGPGAGRPPGGQALERRTLRALLAKHYQEEVEIEVEDPKTHKMVKMKKPRALAMMEKLYEIGIKNGNDAAIDRWLNRALGKAPQPLIGDEDEDPIRVDLGAERILKKVYGSNDDDSDEDEG